MLDLREALGLTRDSSPTACRSCGALCAPIPYGEHDFKPVPYCEACVMARIEDDNHARSREEFEAFKSRLQASGVSTKDLEELKKKGVTLEAPIRRVVEGERLGAYIYSEPKGTGKTSQLQLALLASARKGEGVYLTTEGALLDSLKGDKDKVRIEAYARVGVLAIDECATRAGTPFEVGQMFELINTRYLHERPTLWASNHELKDLVEHHPLYSGRTGERILAMMGDKTQMLTLHKQWRSVGTLNFFL